MSAEWGNAHLRHGALYYSDSISDDAQPGKVTSFPQAVQLKDGEVIALAWVVYRSKEDRDRISKAVMEDPKLKESMDPSKMPFDGKRMFWGGFETIIGLAARPVRRQSWPLLTSSSPRSNWRGSTGSASPMSPQSTGKPGTPSSRRKSSFVVTSSGWRSSVARCRPAARYRRIIGSMATAARSECPSYSATSRRWPYTA
jgi:uncharacterized protein YbaA (DUF1428 family)